MSISSRLGLHICSILNPFEHLCSLSIAASDQASPCPTSHVHSRSSNFYPTTSIFMQAMICILMPEPFQFATSHHIIILSPYWSSLNYADFQLHCPGFSLIDHTLKTHTYIHTNLYIEKF